MSHYPEHLRDGMVSVPKRTLIDLLNVALRNEHRTMHEQAGIYASIISLELDDNTSENQKYTDVLYAWAAASWADHVCSDCKTPYDRFAAEAADDRCTFCSTYGAKVGA